LAKSEAALAQAHIDSEQWASRSRSQLEKKTASTAETQRQLAAAQARCKALVDECTETATAREKFERECGALREALAKSESRLEDARRTAKEAQERSHQELKETVSKASAARQLAAAEARWKEESQHAIARIQAQADAARSDGSGETERLREEFETAQQLLSEKDAELARLRVEAEGIRREIDRHAKDAVVLAEKSWKANEASRLAAAEAAWKKRSTRELADATARFEAAERALAQLRIRNSARDASDNTEIARLRDELAALQSSAAESSNNPWTGAAEDTRIVLRTNKDWDNLAQARTAKSRRKGAAAGMLVAALLAAAAFTLYVGTQVLVPQFSMQGLSTLVTTNGPETAATVKAAPEPDKTPKVVLTHGANLREGPNTTTPVISSLPKGAEVIPGEQRGKWTQVRIADGHQGWVFTEFLQPQTQESSGSPAAAKAK
jgi:hypothetical protein